MRALFGSFASLGLLALLLLPALPALSGCDSDGGEPVTCGADPVAFDIEDITPDGTEVGEAIEDGACVSVTYAGRLTDGTEFDSGSGLNVYVGQGSTVINGFWLGIREQKVGETRRITIPPSLGYQERAITGPDGEDIIPACSVLEFDVTVDDILAPSSCQRRF